MSLSIYTEWGAVAGEFLAGDVVAGQEGDQVTLPATLVLQDEDAAYRVETEDLALAHGASVWATGWKGRTLAMAGTLRADTAEALHGLLRTLRAAAARVDQWLLVDGVRMLRLGALQKMDVNLVELWGRTMADVRLAWTVGDPFWYVVPVASHTETPAGDGTFTVDAGTVATVDMPLRIRITAPAGASLPSVTLACGGRSCTYADPALAGGATVEIDSEAGTVRRDGAPSTRWFAGAWPVLNPGANSWTYAGGACTIEFLWRPRWA